MFGTILQFFIPKPKEDILNIPEVKLKNYKIELEGQIDSLLVRIKRVEGSYGQLIQEYKAEIKELKEENEEMAGELAEAQDLIAKRDKMLKLAPEALAKSGLPPEQQTHILTWMASPANQATVDGLLEQYFPDTPITTEGLVSLLPIALPIITSLLPKPAQQNPENKSLF